MRVIQTFPTMDIEELSHDTICVTFRTLRWIYTPRVRCHGHVLQLIPCLNPVYQCTMNACKESRGRPIVRLILNLDTGCKGAVKFKTSTALLPRKDHSVPFEQEAGWTPRPVWTFWIRQKLLAPCAIRTPDFPVRSLVTKQTALSTAEFVSNFCWLFATN